MESEAGCALVPLHPQSSVVGLDEGRFIAPTFASVVFPWKKLAEGVGFEPTNRLPCCRFSVPLRLSPPDDRSPVRGLDFVITLARRP